MKKGGMIFVVSAPSGTGKTTVIKRFLRRHKNDFVLSVSATTRKPRKGEVHGKDYFFYTKNKFRQLMKEDKFIEYARVLDNYYGTLRETVMKSVKKGKNVIMDIDVQGARRIKNRIKDCVTVFILPPTFKELEKRLKKRKTETKKDMRSRLFLAKKELKERKKYDYIVINEDIGRTVELLECVLLLEKHKNYEMK